MRLDLAITSSTRNVELTFTRLLGLRGQYPPRTVDFNIELTFDRFLEKKAGLFVGHPLVKSAI